MADNFELRRELHALGPHLLGILQAPERLRSYWAEAQAEMARTMPPRPSAS